MKSQMIRSAILICSLWLGGCGAAETALPTSTVAAAEPTVIAAAVIGPTHTPTSPPTATPVASPTPTQMPTEVPSPTAVPTQALTPTPEVVAAAFVGNPGFNLLLVAEGDIQLRRPTWTDFFPATFGTILERGDLLKVLGGAKVLILCDNLQAEPVPPRNAPTGVNAICQEPDQPALVRGGASVGRTRGGGQIPYIISPRATSLLSQTPLLRWNDTGATSYTVIVRSEDAIIWSQPGITGSELRYPGEPALEPGVSYFLVIEDSKGATSTGGSQENLDFQRLPDIEVQRIQADVESITALKLSEEAETLAIARLYSGNDLTAEAIELLEPLAAANTQEVAIYHLLGDLYANIGLAALALPHYQRALELAEPQGNIEAIATIHARLGEEVYIVLNDAESLVVSLQTAQKIYETLGDIERANQLAALAAVWE